MRGHLWQGRFFSCPLDQEHLYEAVRYVELNSFRAKIVGDAGEYYWSSAYDRLNEEVNYHLHSVIKYLEIDDWRAYLYEEVNEEIVQAIRDKTQSELE